MLEDALPDGGVGNCFESGSLLGIGENPRAQGGSIKRAIGQDDGFAKMAADGVQRRFSGRDDLARDTISVDHINAFVRQIVAGHRFAAATPSGQTNNQQGSVFPEVQVPVNDIRPAEQGNEARDGKIRPKGKGGALLADGHVDTADDRADKR